MSLDNEELYCSLFVEKKEQLITKKWMMAGGYDFLTWLSKNNPHVVAKIKTGYNTLEGEALFLTLREQTESELVDQQIKRPSCEYGEKVGKCIVEAVPLLADPIATRALIERCYSIDGMDKVEGSQLHRYLMKITLVARADKTIQVSGGCYRAL